MGERGRSFGHYLAAEIRAQTVAFIPFPLQQILRGVRRGMANGARWVGVPPNQQDQLPQQQQLSRIRKPLCLSVLEKAILIRKPDFAPDDTHVRIAVR